MDAKRLSQGNIVWFKNKPWVVYSTTNTGAYLEGFENHEASDFAIFKDIQGIQITVASLAVYLGLIMERDENSVVNDQDWWDKDTHRIRIVMKGWTNRPDEGDAQARYVHVDNADMDTLGSADLIYINELQNFLNSIGYKR